MKYLLKIFFFFFLIHPLCGNTQIVKTVQDLKRLDSNKHLFIHKPLSILLKEIRPTIRTVIGRSQIGEEGGYILFFFRSRDSLNFNRGKKPYALKVYLEPGFVWDPEGRHKGGNLYIWTKKDSQEYGNEIVLFLQVGG